MTKRRVSTWAVGGVVLLAAVAVLAFGRGDGSGSGVAQAEVVPIDLDRATEIALPEIAADLKPAEFTTTDGKRGWALRLPGGRPIATPAYADGLLFVGGGYGSHEFYAVDAKTGEVRWQMTTQDDGPTAAVVENGRVAFNTESCTVVVADAKTGKVVWQEWLGDPLMSQPAISEGRLFIAYPASKGDGKHRLLCADLETGKHLWEQPITGDAISAPVVDGGRVYLTCFDGTAFCLETKDGTVVWKRAAEGTSAPVVVAGRVYEMRRVAAGGVTKEGIQQVDAARGVRTRDSTWALGHAKYLEAGGGGGVAFEVGQAESLDASVGFAQAPAAASLEAASANTGVGRVVEGWAFQGSRVAYSRGSLFNGQGTYLNCVDAESGGARWRAEARGAQVKEGMQLFSPPALGKRHLYLASAHGHLLSVDPAEGKVRFLYATKQPIVLQPALAEGRMYAGTANGLLLCLATGDDDADGWYAWGGNAQHNLER